MWEVGIVLGEFVGTQHVDSNYTSTRLWPKKQDRHQHVVVVAYQESQHVGASPGFWAKPKHPESEFARAAGPPQRLVRRAASEN